MVARTAEQVLNQVYNEVTDSLQVMVVAGDTTGGYWTAGNRYFVEGLTAVKPSWGTAYEFGFLSQGIMLRNLDHTYDIEISYDGTSIHGKIYVGERVVYDNRHENKLYLRADSTASFSLEVW